MDRNKETILRMITKKRLELNFFGYLDHYKLPIFCLIPPGLAMYDFIKTLVIGQSVGTRTPEEMFAATSPFLAVSIVLFYLQWRKLRFVEFNTALSLEKFRQVIDQLVTNLNLSVLMNESDLFIGFRRASWVTGTNSESIYVIRTEKSILFCSPQNKKSVRDFIRVLFHATDPARSKPPASITPESEWSTKGTLKRLVIYSICLILTLLMLLILREDRSIRALLITIPVLIACITYVVLDIRILRSERKSD